MAAVKPEYVAMSEALGGQVISLDHTKGALNVLDPFETLRGIGDLLADSDRPGGVEDAAGKQESGPRGNR